jgi:hypothetical protein
MNSEAAPAEPEVCGCETCVIRKLLDHVSVSGTEALRWVLAVQFGARMILLDPSADRFGRIAERSKTRRSGWLRCPR